VEALALTKLDVLDAFESIPICVAYRWRDQILDSLPDDIEVFAECEPVYESLPGWQTETAGIVAEDQLPVGAKRYVARIEELLGVPVVLISTGPRREETIFRSHGFFTRWLGGKLPLDRG
jgi:adenylosuccinate synthase